MQMILLPTWREKTMSLKSSGLTMLFVLLGTILVCLFAYGYAPNMMHALAPQLPLEIADVLVMLFLIALAVLFLALKADPTVIIVTGTIGIFTTLTCHQSELVRYMTFAALLFCLGMYGMVVSRNAVRVLMSIELMLNGVNINLVALSRFVDPIEMRGQVFAIFILTVAAAEAAVGLAIVLAAYRNMSTVDMEKFNLLKW
jgi:NAD(P)H-quinone oxidoreductase subunit 4L